MRSDKDVINSYSVFQNLNTLQTLEYIKILIALHIAITHANELKQLSSTRQFT